MGEMAGGLELYIEMFGRRVNPATGAWPNPCTGCCALVRSHKLHQGLNHNCGISRG
jgi:hypothetical protein